MHCSEPPAILPFCSSVFLPFCSSDLLVLDRSRAGGPARGRSARATRRWRSGARRRRRGGTRRGRNGARRRRRALRGSDRARRRARGRMHRVIGLVRVRHALDEAARHLAEPAHTLTRLVDHRRRNARHRGRGRLRGLLGDSLARSSFARRLWSRALGARALGTGALGRDALRWTARLLCRPLRRRALPRPSLGRSTAGLGSLGRRTGRLALRCHGWSSRVGRVRGVDKKDPRPRAIGQGNRPHPPAAGHRQVTPSDGRSVVGRVAGFCHSVRNGRGPGPASGYLNRGLGTPGPDTP
jgi:hypothetical protein